jgi:molybdenum cofactor guanylyltransferase
VNDHGKRGRRRKREPIGAILAGGLGRRIGGSKAIVELNGRPLISYPLEAMKGALGEVVIVAKFDTELPSLPGATVWIELEQNHHPLVGLVEALGLADRRPVLVCAADFPFVTTDLIRRIAHVDVGSAVAAVACSNNAIQPLLGRYEPTAIDSLRATGIGDDVPLREIVASVDPVLVEVDDPDELFNVNSPDDLLQAAAMLDRRLSRT